MSVVLKQENVILFPTHPDERAGKELSAFVERMKGYAPGILGVTNWKSHVWDVTGYESTKNPGKEQQRKKLLFTQLVGKENKVKVSEDEMAPFEGLFADLVKAHAVYRHKRKAKTKDNHMVAVRAFRYLYCTLERTGHNPISLTNRHFMEALTMAANREAESSSYRIGVHLEEIANFLDKYNLTATPIRFRNKIPRPKGRGLNTEEAAAARRHALPSLEVIEAIGKLGQMELAKEEAIVIRVVTLLLFTGFRINEVLELPVDCLIEHQNINPRNGEIEVKWSIGYRARKGGEWQGKWLADIKVPVIKKAIDDLIELCADAREVVRFHEDNGFSRIYQFRHFEPNELKTSKELVEAFGNSLVRMDKFLRHRKVKPTNPHHSPLLFRVKDVELEFFKDVYKDPILINSLRTIPMSEALIAVFHQQFHDNKATLNYAVEPLQLGQIQDQLQGRPTINMPSIFDKYGFTGPSGESLGLRTHQPRHWLSTLAEEGGEMSPLEIARFFGRKYIADNEAYNHNLNPGADTKEVANKMMVEHNMTHDAIQKFAREFPLLDWNAAVEMADDLGACLITDIGICQSVYGQPPCSNHLACLRGCQQYRRQKGNRNEVVRIEQILEDTTRAVTQAKEALGEEAWGANNWVNHHTMVIKGCELALLIETKIEIPDGTMVQVFTTDNAM